MRSIYCMIALGTVLVVAGCKGGPVARVQKAATPAIPQGWKNHIEPDRHFSIAAPDNWRISRRKTKEDLAAEGHTGQQAEALARLSSALDEMELEKMEEKRKRDATRGIFLTLYDVGVRQLPSELSTCLKVKIEDKGKNLTLADAATIVRPELRSHGVDAKIFEEKDVTLPIGPAKRFEIETQNRIGDTVGIISYCLVNGKDLVQLQFLGQGGLSGIKPVADPIAETFRIDPAK